MKLRHLKRQTCDKSQRSTFERRESNVVDHLSNCRSKATSSLVIYFLLLQSIPVRAVVVEKSSSYRYQGPVVQTGSGSSVKPFNELIQPEETTRMKGKKTSCILEAVAAVMWPDVGLKSGRSVFKWRQKSTHNSFYLCSIHIGTWYLINRASVLRKMH